jgi:DNA-binding transcriptional LysR family regulator
VQPDPELHATRLFSDVLTPLCGKRYKDKLKTLEDLKRVPFIDMTYDPEWSIWLRAGRHGRLQAQARLDLRLDHDRGSRRRWRGAGVAVGPAAAVREELAEGRLFQPFPQIVDSGKAWWFVCPPSSATRPKTRAFEDWLVEELSAPPVRSGRPIAVAGSRR